MREGPEVGLRFLQPERSSFSRPCSFSIDILRTLGQKKISFAWSLKAASERDYIVTMFVIYTHCIQVEFDGMRYL